MGVQPVGYIKLWRELLSKPIWYESTPEQKVILITLLSMANFGGKRWEWQGKQFKAEPGQLVTSLARLTAAAGQGVTMQNVRTALVRFEKYGFLTNVSTKTGRLITIVNWQVYQTTAGAANKEANKDLTPREEVKKVRSKEVKTYCATFEAFWTIYPRRKEKPAAFRVWQKTVKDINPDLLIKAATGYAKQCLHDGTEERYTKLASTFLNSGAYEDFLTTTTRVFGPTAADLEYQRKMLSEMTSGGGDDLTPGERKMLSKMTSGERKMLSDSEEPLPTE